MVEGEVLLCPYWGGELKDMAVGQYQGYRFGDWDVRWDGILAHGHMPAEFGRRPTQTGGS